MEKSIAKIDVRNFYEKLIKKVGEEKAKGVLFKKILNDINKK